MEFIIPLDRKDLLDQDEENQYFVREQYEVQDLCDKIEEFRNTLNGGGDSCAIVSHFDVFYGYLAYVDAVKRKHFEELQFDDVKTSWNALLDGLSVLSEDLSEYLKEVAASGHESAERRKQYLCALQMTVYLATQFADCCEIRAESFAKAAQPAIEKKKKGGRRQTTVEAHEDWNWNWDYEKQKLLLKLHAFLQQNNVKLLWDPPVVDEQFANAISNCCYKFLESAASCKIKPLMNCVSAMVGCLVEKYNHSMGSAVKFMQLLQQYEHVSPVLVDIAAVVCETYHSKTFIPDISRELHRIDTSELAREGGTAKNYSTFLVDLTERLPEQIFPCISLITSHLDGESYTMRNAVLSVLKILVLRLMTHEDLDDNKRATRDQLLEKLQEHIFDVNAFVRARCVQLWAELCKDKGIPLPRLRSLLPQLITRLQDKASTVRSKTIHFLTAFLEGNPFMDRLNVEDLKKSYNAELESLAAMKPEGEDAEQKAAESAWEQKVENIRAAVAEWQKQKDDEDSPDNADTLEEVKAVVEESEDFESLMNDVYKAIDEECYADACWMMLVSARKWKKHEFIVPLIDKGLLEEYEVVAPVMNGEVHDNETEGEAEEEPNQQPINNVASARNSAVENALVQFFHKLFIEQRLMQSLESARTKTDNAAGGQNEDGAAAPTVAVSAYMRQKLMVQYLKDCVTFAESIQGTLPTVCSLLHSSTTTDLLEALAFIVTCVEFRIGGSTNIYRKTFNLIWSKEPAVKEAQVKSFKRLYLDVEDKSVRNRAQAVGKNLISLVVDADESELKSMEEVIAELIRQKLLDLGVLRYLWERFIVLEGDGNRKADKQIKACVKLLTMAANIERTLISSNMNQLITCGLGGASRSDFEFARDVCMALCRLAQAPVTKDKVTEGKNAPWRLPSNHFLFERLRDLVVEGYTVLEDRFWVPMAEAALNVIFALSEHPDVVSTKILTEIAAILKVQVGEDVDDVEHEPELNPARADTATKCPVMLLTRMFAVVGHLATKLLVHLDVALCNELKRRTAEKIRKGGKAAIASLKKQKSAAKYRRLSSMRSSAGGGDATAEELGLAGASTEDAEQEFVSYLCEDVLLSDDHILGQLAPLIQTVCKQSDDFKSGHLQTAAALALTKFMMLSSNFCEKNLTLVFTMLDKSPFNTVRSNCMIALGDMCFRYPNLVEPWTHHLYERLKDEDLLVRHNCILVLTHLILNDMIKVKGHIADISLCILDPNVTISFLARTFFKEFSQKGNNIYNLMPDIISRLCEAKLHSEEFKQVTRYLFALIHKERQCEGLVEKLCQRFQASQSKKQWRLLSHCLTLCSHTDKSIRKLQENTTCFADKLSDEEVFNNLIGILAVVRKNAKTDIKGLLDEVEDQWTKLHQEGFADDEAAKRAFRALRKEPSSSQSTQNTPSSSQRKNSQTGSAVRRTTRRQPASARKSKMPMLEDEDSDDDFVSAKPRSRPSYINDTPPETAAQRRSSRISAVDRSAAKKKLDVGAAETGPSSRRSSRPAIVVENLDEEEDEPLPLGPDWEASTDEDEVVSKSPVSSASEAAEIDAPSAKQPRKKHDKGAPTKGKTKPETFRKEKASLKPSTISESDRLTPSQRRPTRAGRAAAKEVSPAPEMRRAGSSSASRTRNNKVIVTDDESAADDNSELNTSAASAASSGRKRRSERSKDKLEESQSPLVKTPKPRRAVARVISSESQSEEEVEREQPVLSATRKGGSRKTAGAETPIAVPSVAVGPRRSNRTSTEIKQEILSNQKAVVVPVQKMKSPAAKSTKSRR